MRKSIRTRVLALAVLAALVVPLSGGLAVADHDPPCNGQVRTVGPLYFDNRGTGDVWIYMESNEVEGLQSGGEGPLSADTSCDHENPDTLIF